jgi:hypothetical protein
VDSTEMAVNDMGLANTWWIHMDLWMTLVCTVMSLRIAFNFGKFLSKSITDNFTKRFLLNSFNWLVNVYINHYNISGSHGDDYEEYRLLGRDAMYLLLGPTIQINVAPPSSGWEDSVY